MTTTQTKASDKNRVFVLSRPNVLKHSVKQVENKPTTWTATKVTNLKPEDTKRPEVKEVIDMFVNTYEVKAPDAAAAATQLQTALRKLLPVAKPEPTKDTTEDAKQAPAAPPETPKQQDEKPAGDKPKKDEKIVASFEYFLEHSQVKCLPLSPDNATVVTQALAYFAAYNQTLHNEEDKLPAKMQEILRHKSDECQSADKLINRTSMRLLVTERDDKKKIVVQFLAKPVYLSPYAISCIVEAHKQHQQNKSMYRDILNMHESVMTVYDVFQFNPNEEFLLPASNSSALKKTKNTVEYQFVNVVAY